MLHPALTVPPGANYWQAAARGVLDALPDLLPACADALHGGRPADLSGLRIVVPAFVQAQSLRNALSGLLGGTCIAPRICTPGSWLALQPPVDVADALAARRASGNERLMALYAELRQHAWLKKLFAARRNIDLLPLAQTLLLLADELSAALWPGMAAEPGSAEQRWERALAQLPPSAQALLSDEAQLVWSVWKTQLDASDPTVALHGRMMALAESACTPLIWFSAITPEACTQAFLASWSRRQPVLPVLLDWRCEALPALLSQAWPELVTPVANHEHGTSATPCAASSEHGSTLDQTDLFTDLADAAPAFPNCWPAGWRPDLRLSPAATLEEEAQGGAQTVVDWLREGKRSIAIVAQDRVVARRIRALLQRAGVGVDDETGWKLSTTRAAASLIAWFDVVNTRADSIALLDFLKSPFLLAAGDALAEQVMVIELALRRANVAGGWGAVMAAIPAGPAREHVQLLADRATLFRQRHTIASWLALTRETMAELGLAPAFVQDIAGLQVLEVLDAIGQACGGLQQEFSFGEWRAYVSLQLEATAFLAPATDRRVVMLPLNGTHLRCFDAVLLVGADAAHLPSSASETLFFANAVRRELGLPTRESRQLQQLRDFAELLTANPVLVLSWQAYREGEPNPVSHWIARLELALARSTHPALPIHRANLAQVELTAQASSMPHPVASHLLPQRLSASGYASLVACPYQFFVNRMLGLSGLDEFSEKIEKRDYGDWLHRILDVYHQAVKEHAVARSARAAFLQEVTDRIFAPELAKSAAALGYHDRWQKAMPAYLMWANQREDDGWQFVVGEAWRERTMQWRGGTIVLHGRIDRIDANADGEQMVLDYKTSNPGILRKRIASSEDHQLAFYGLLCEMPPASAAYVALEPVKESISAVPAPDYAAWQARLQERIDGTLSAISDGVPLRASGIDTVCRYCDVRGLCRKGAW